MGGRLEAARRPILLSNSGHLRSPKSHRCHRSRCDRYPTWTVGVEVESNRRQVQARCALYSGLPEDDIQDIGLNHPFNRQSPCRPQSTTGLPRWRQRRNQRAQEAGERTHKGRPQRQRCSIQLPHVGRNDGVCQPFNWQDDHQLHQSQRRNHCRHPGNHTRCRCLGPLHARARRSPPTYATDGSHRGIHRERWQTQPRTNRSRSSRESLPATASSSRI